MEVVHLVHLSRALPQFGHGGHGGVGGGGQHGGDWSRGPYMCSCVLVTWTIHVLLCIGGLTFLYFLCSVRGNKVRCASYLPSSSLFSDCLSIAYPGYPTPRWYHAEWGGVGGAGGRRDGRGWGGLAHARRWGRRRRTDAHVDAAQYRVHGSRHIHRVSGGGR